MAQQRTGSDSDELGFSPRQRLRWLSIGLLLHTAKAVLVSTAFGNFVDRRELEAIQPTDPETLDIVDLSGEQEVWIDYVSDPGDGFDAAVAIASLAGRTEALELTDPDGAAVTVEPCRLLVLGGDQAYPIGSRDNYHDCLRGPYRSTSTEFDSDRTLLAIPGNHDWYDGLVSFIRTFCQQRRIGGWQTRQKRSYFAVQLPQNWWLWGIDIQLDEDIDEPQLDYFAKVAERLGEGAGIILCWAKPSWVETTPANPAPYAQIEYFERRVIPAHAEVRIALSGDSHHYVRYENHETGSQKITAGGGGAYLASTHRLPAELELPDGSGHPPAERKFVTYQRKARYPTRDDSLRLSRQLLLRPWRIFQNRTLYLIPAVMYLFLARAINDAERVFVERQAGQPFTLQPLIVCVLTLVVVGAGLHAFATDARKSSSWRRWVASTEHLLLHLVVVTALIWFVDSHQEAVAREPVAVTAIVVAVGIVIVPLAALLVADKLWLRRELGGWIGPLVAAGVAIVLVGLLVGLGVVVGLASNQFAAVEPATMLSVLAFDVGAVVGTFVVAFYLVVAGNWLSINTNEQFAAQAIPDYKSFLAMRVSTDGVDIHPVAVDRVPRWRKLPATTGELQEMVRGPKKPAARLIENRIRVAREYRSADASARTADASA